MATRGPQQKEVKRIKTCAKDGGNRVLAFEILNLHNRKIKPLGRPPPVMLPKAQFIIHANAILANICPAQWALGTPYRVESRKAVEKVMSALLTIARVHREMLPVWNLNALITIGPGDFAANVVWATLAPPLPALAHRAARALLRGGPRGANITTPLPTDAPTRRDASVFQAMLRGNWIGSNLALAGSAVLTIAPTNLPVRTFPVHDDGNCYFRAIAKGLYGNQDDHPKVKADIRFYFMNHMSVVPPGLTVPQRDMITCLHKNDPFSFRVMRRPPTRWGLNQVVADYYNAEVIEFADPGTHNPPNLIVGAPGVQITHIARGNKNARQIWIYRTPKTAGNWWRNPRTEAIIAPAGARLVDFRWDTSLDTNDQRMEYLPWLPGAALVAIPPGIPVGIQNFMMPLSLPQDITHQNPAMRAPAGEVAYVAAGKDMPMGPNPLQPIAAMLAWPGQ